MGNASTQKRGESKTFKHSVLVHRANDKMVNTKHARLFCNRREIIHVCKNATKKKRAEMHGHEEEDDEGKKLSYQQQKII